MESTVTTRTFDYDDEGRILRETVVVAERHRPEPGILLAPDDPRVVAAITASRCLGTFDWRDVAEIVNAVLEADDRIPGEAS